MPKFAEIPEHKMIVDTIQKWACNNPEISRVLIYGSRARGEQRPDSDIDIAVELKPTRDDEKPFVIWMNQGDVWHEELQPLIPWRLHLEWHDLDGSTPRVAEKLRKGYCLIVDSNTS